MLNLRSLVFLAATLVAASPVTYADTMSSNLPDLGDPAATVMSVADEAEIGRNFMQHARQQLDFVKDPILNDYINSVGDRLVAHTGTSLKFHFFMIADPSINAFAVPGGYVGVHTGLIMATKNEDELAAVLAHECTHVLQHHLARLLSAAKQRTLPTMAALIAAVLLGGQAGEAAVALTTAGAAESQLVYTRSFEEEADRIGMQTLEKSGYDPQAMPAFFEQLEKDSRVYDTVPGFLQDHPVTSDRIAEARDRADQYPPVKRVDHPAFDEARARIRVMMSTNPRETVKYFEANLRNKHYANRDAERYGLALALSAAERYTDARKEIDGLLADKPDVTVYQIAKAEIEMDAGNYRKGVDLYAAAFAKHPRYQPLTQLYAGALLKVNQAAPAKKLLESAVRKDHDNPTLYKMLAVAAGNTGDPVAAHRAMAEYDYLNGDSKAAITQLELASRYARGDFYIQSSVDARIREIKNEMALYKDNKDS